MTPNSHGSHDDSNRRTILKQYLAALLAPLLSIANTHTAAFAADKCSEAGMTATEVENCLKKTSEADKALLRKQTTFPIRFHGSTFDPKTSREAAVDWSSKDGSSLDITTPHICGLAGCAAVGKLIESIPVKQIVSYEMNLIGKGTNASEQIQGVAITALFAPIIAPFSATINAKSTEEYLWRILYIGEDGLEIAATFRTESTVPVADRYYTFLPTLTGLNPQQRRAESQLIPFYLEAASKLELQARNDAQLLIEADNKKPWCTRLKKDVYPMIYSRYIKTAQTLSQLRQKIGQESTASEASTSSEALWNDYLKDNTSFATWAKANPTAAAKIRKCSSLNN